MKRNALILVVTLLFGYPLAHGQQVPDHKSMMNETWERIDELMYKVTTNDDGTTSYTPFFPKPLQELDGTVVTLPGYMIPFELGREHHMFLISVLPVMQCMFCGQNGIPPMVQVTMKTGKARFSNHPFKVKGRIHLNTDMEKGAEVQLLDAEVIN
ncbi:hypothetical protein GCM10023231_13550 [Olivibacter ginsenosidimutans]|uniref:DUF3299 domain-containing protein n=1 Tax=Olivibacter ginsenosidimutans TaxID=1176537 RepID=A0ABP9AWP5_9SPHI